MSLLSETKVDFIYESTQARNSKNPKSLSFKADQAGRPIASIFRQISSWRSVREATKRNKEIK